MNLFQNLRREDWPFAHALLAEGTLVLFVFGLIRLVTL